MRTTTLAALAMLLPTIAAAEITVVSTDPPTGARDVAPTLSEVRIRFSAPVRTDRYSIVTTDQGRQLNVIGSLAFEEDGRVCVLAVKLAPGTTYSYSVNSARYTGFCSAADPNDVVKPYLVVFTTSGEGPATKSPTQRWREDLALLADLLPKSHKQLFFQLTEEQFRHQVADLDRRLPDLNEDQSAVELTKLVASVGDAHTKLSFWGPLAAVRLPIALYWFQDGLFVVAATKEQRELLGCRLQRVGDQEIAAVCRQLAAFISHENEAQVKNAAPELLVFPRLLVALGLLPQSDSVPLTLITPEGKEVALQLAAANPEAIGKMIQAYNLPADSRPPYLRNTRAAYWIEHLEDPGVIYLQYNRCQEAPTYPIVRLQADLEALLQEHPTAPLVIDLRHNGGGDSSVLDPLIAALAAKPRFQQKGSLFVIVGRRTFSSAILNALDLRDQAQAIVVGEPTGGKPNHFGEVQTILLPNSGLSVSYSTKFFQTSKTDAPSLMPDLLAAQTYADYTSGTDPALAAVISYRDRATQGIQP